MSYVGSSFISQPVQDELDGKVSLVSATKQTIGSALDVSGNINLPTGSQYLINGIPSGRETFETINITTPYVYLSQASITYIASISPSAGIPTLELPEGLYAGQTKTIWNGLSPTRINVLDPYDDMPDILRVQNISSYMFNGAIWHSETSSISSYDIDTFRLTWGTDYASSLTQQGNINLPTGRQYQINGINLPAVAETLSNKTISGTSNTILNLPISSTTGLQTALDGKVALVSATKQTIGSALDVSGNINLPTGSQYQINGVSITAGGGGGGTPGGVEGSVQYNASGAFAGESDFNYSASTNTLTLTNGTLRPSVINFNSDNIAIGGNSAMIGQGAFAVAIGDGAGKTSQQVGAVAIGSSAGINYQSVGAVAIGESAGQTYQGELCVAIGSSAGGNQTNRSIAIGPDAGRDGQSGFGIAIGYRAGTAQDSNCIAIGREAGGSNGQLTNAIAIGATAGGVGQEVNCLAIGANAGYLQQKENSIAIGYGAGQERQGAFNLTGNGIAIGYEAGNTNQGTNAIAIGYKAGKFYQANQSICINATGDNLDAQTENALFIKPIRNETNLSGFLQLYYNPSTGELVYN